MGQSLDKRSAKGEQEGIDDIKKLPIYMKEKRALYRDLMTVYHFENDGSELTRKQMQRFGRCFRLRLFWKMICHYYDTYELWETSVREIEIQRGTLTSNVFLFIKWSLNFNIVIAVIVTTLVLLPRVYLSFYQAPPTNAIDCTQLFMPFDQEEYANWSKATIDLLALPRNKEIVSSCCHDLYLKNFSGSVSALNTTHLQWLITLANFLGGQSSWLTTPLFYGYYRPPPWTSQTQKDMIRIAYAMAVFLILIFSFSKLIKSISDGVQEIVRNKDGENLAFTELVFNGYNSRTRDANEARFRRKLWLRDLRVSIKRAKTFTKAGKKEGYALLLIRTFSNVFIFLAMGLLGYGIYQLTHYSKLQSESSVVNTTGSLFLKIGYVILPSLSVTVCNIIFANVFIKVGKQEKYSMEASTTLILFRSLTFRLISLFVLLIRYFINDYQCWRVIPGTCTKCPQDGEGGDRKTCWESLLAQELYKLLVIELIVKVISAFVIDPFRRFLKKVFIRFKVMRKLGTLRFNAIRHSLDIINIQVIAWIGFYFAPFYPIMVIIYIVVMFHVKKFSALVNCVETPEVYKITRTTVIFLSGLMFCFIIVAGFLIGVVGFIEPSNGCGPFGEYVQAWDTVTQVFGGGKDSEWSELFNQIGAPSVYLLLQFFGFSVLFYYWSVMHLQREEADKVKELILMEKEDKEYLITRLEELRLKKKIKTFYDPNAVFASEKKYIESSHGADHVMAKIYSAWGEVNQLEQLPDLKETVPAMPVLEDRENKDRKRNQFLVKARDKQKKFKSKMSVTSRRSNFAQSGFKRKSDQKESLTQLKPKPNEPPSPPPSGPPNPAPSSPPHSPPSSPPHPLPFTSFPKSPNP